VWDWQHLLSTVNQGWDLSRPGNENWFDLNTGHESMWLQRNGAEPVRGKKTMSSSNIMLTVFSSARGSVLIEKRPKWQTFDSLSFSQTISTTLHMRRPTPSTGWRTLIRMGNAGAINQKRD
jgi:hypothetical protein